MHNFTSQPSYTTRAARQAHCVLWNLLMALKRSWIMLDYWRIPVFPGVHIPTDVPVCTFLTWQDSHSLQYTHFVDCCFLNTCQLHHIFTLFSIRWRLLVPGLTWSWFQQLLYSVSFKWIQNFSQNSIFLSNDMFTNIVVTCENVSFLPP